MKGKSLQFPHSVISWRTQRIEQKSDKIRSDSHWSFNLSINGEVMKGKGKISDSSDVYIDFRIMCH